MANERAVGMRRYENESKGRGRVLTHPNIGFALYYGWSIFWDILQGKIVLDEMLLISIVARQGHRLAGPCLFY